MHRGRPPRLRRYYMFVIFAEARGRSFPGREGPCTACLAQPSGMSGATSGSAPWPCVRRCESSSIRTIFPSPKLCSSPLRRMPAASSHACVRRNASAWTALGLLEPRSARLIAAGCFRAPAGVQLGLTALGELAKAPHVRVILGLVLVRCVPRARGRRPTPRPTSARRSPRRTRLTARRSSSVEAFTKASSSRAPT